MGSETPYLMGATTLYHTQLPACAHAHNI